MRFLLVWIIESNTALFAAGRASRPGAAGTVESRCIVSGFGIA
jgi:hypothetical protein